MTNLSCSVTNCVNNEDDMCCLNDIKVDGNDASDKEETCCSSFESRESSSHNMDYVAEPEPETEIECDARDCIYNEEKECIAPEIHVSGDGASDPEQTECHTFRIK